MRRLPRQLTLGGLCLLLTALACNISAPSTPAVVSEATVQLDITSGLPAPEWTLTAAEIALFEQTLRDLPPASAVVLFDGLGYRGFVVTINAPKRLIRAQNGYVVVEYGGTTRTFRDEDRQIEKWLLTTGKSHLDPQLYRLMEDDLQ